MVSAVLVSIYRHLAAVPAHDGTFSDRDVIHGGDLGTADPIAMILSGAMLLRHLGEVAAAENVEWAVDEVLRQGRIRTPDLGGDASTMQVAEEIAMTVSAWEHGPS